MSGVANRRERRVSMSFSPEQVIWLAAVLATLQRGGDVSVLARNERAAELLALFGRARDRTEHFKPSLGPPRYVKDLAHARQDEMLDELAQRRVV